ncbi:MAG: DUF1667 domain-containing protein [Oscillospiraceae bacterium]|nr:DUF1667 domain-containing protein [Oscillospiraceae bacterium]
MKRQLTCIICPRGCALEATVQDGQVTVTGNACQRGAEYAVSECLHPVRTVTTIVKVANRENTMVSVKTETPVPKESMAEVVAALRKLSVAAPVAVGDVIAENVCGSRIVATKDIT